MEFYGVLKLKNNMQNRIKEQWGIILDKVEGTFPIRLHFLRILPTKYYVFFILLVMFALFRNIPEWIEQKLTDGPSWLGFSIVKTVFACVIITFLAGEIIRTTLIKFARNNEHPTIHKIAKEIYKREGVESYLFISCIGILVCCYLVWSNAIVIKNVFSTFALSAIPALLGTYIIAIDDRTKRHIQLQLERARKTQNDLLEAQKSIYHANAVLQLLNMHTLKNALSTIYEDVDNAGLSQAEHIRKLADIVEHVFSNTNKGKKITLEDDIKFADEFIEFSRWLWADGNHENIRITKDIPALSTETIWPMFTIPLIENAFQYGISQEKPYFINIDIACKSNELYFKIENSIISQEDPKRTGKGIELLKKQLNMLYLDKHQLLISKTEQVYTVTLKVNLL